MQIRRRFLLLSTALLLLLAGCRLDLNQVGIPPTPSALTTDTVVSAAQISMETPTSSATITLEPQIGDTPLPAISPTESPNYTPTTTITPWPNDTPTAGPSPTRTRTPTRTRIPTRTRAPSLTPTITNTPTITFTPTPPPPVHELLRPGLMSKVTTPIEMEMYAVTGADRRVTIELIGEDGRLIAQEMMEYSHPGRNIWAAPELPFTIDAVSEIARLQISSRDGFGRLEALTSVDLVLLSVGRDEVHPQAVTMEPYLIRSPDQGDTVSGGKLILEALARPINDSPVIVELLTDNGSVLASAQASVATPGGALSHTPFTLDINYEVKDATPVRLVIRQEGSRIPGTVALTSLTLILEP